LNTDAQLGAQDDDRSIESKMRDPDKQKAVHTRHASRISGVTTGGDREYSREQRL
jgi:hypothetical protein